jgi:hypothetical protein
MKYILMISSIILSQQVLALPQNLNCKAQNANTLAFNIRYGELVIKNRAGQALLDLDALMLGQTKFGESIPPVMTTSILHADERRSTPAFGYIRESRENVSVQVKNVIYYCR